MKDEKEYSFFKFFSRKFLIFWIILIVASVFLWFGKISERTGMTVWLIGAFVYGLWNIIEKIVDKISVSEIRNLISSINSLKQSIMEIKNNGDNG